MIGFAYVLPLPPPINLSAMADLVNHDSLLVLKNFVRNAIISHTKFVEPCEVARQGIGVRPVVQKHNPPKPTSADTP